MTQHDEHVQNAERGRRNGEKVANNGVRNVIRKERSPGLQRRLPGAGHVLGHRPFRSVVAQQKQLRQNSRRASQRILTGHAANEVANFTFDGRASGLPGHQECSDQKVNRLDDAHAEVSQASQLARIGDIFYSPKRIRTSLTTCSVAFRPLRNRSDRQSGATPPRQSSSAATTSLLACWRPSSVWRNVAF